MPARYSDRFFGPDGTSRPPAERADEIDLIEPSGDPPRSAEPGSLEVVESRPAPEKPWYTARLAWAALVGAVLLGAAAGAYGWDAWRDRQVEIVARSTVDVNIDASMVDFAPEGGGTSYSVRVRNDGTFPITFTGVAALDPRLRLQAEEFTPTELAPDEDVVRAVRFDYDCQSSREPDAESRDALAVQLRTVDGGEHQERLAVTGGTMQMSSLSDQCSYFQQVSTSLTDAYVEITNVEQASDTAVSASVFVHAYDNPAQEVPEIQEVTAQTPAFSVSFEAAAALRENAPLFTVTWAVADCQQALVAGELDMSLSITGQMPGQERSSIATAYPTPDLAAALARLAERACG